MRTRVLMGAVVVSMATAGLISADPPRAAAAPAGPAVADLRADVNRDGVVDVRGPSDESGESSWSAARGAIFLPNLDDDSRRCRARAADGGPLSDAALAGCNDAADARVNGPADAADLARLRTVPVPGAGPSTTATVTVSGAGAAARTRIFVRAAAAWTPVGTLTSAQLRAGVEFGVEASDIARPGRWNGLATVTLTFADGSRRSADSVVLKVAPLLLHHPLQRAEQVLVTRENGTAPAARESQRFVADLAAQVRAAGLTSPLFSFSFPPDSEEQDIWTQDFFEPGFVTMPGTGGTPVGMRLLLRSPQNHLPSGRKSGRQLYERLRGPGVGILEVPGMTTAEEWTLSSMGNLETLPPYRSGTRNFPNGRIVLGQRAETGSKPAAALLDLLAAQGAQSPLLLDTSWLSIGHVDEFLHFLPARTPRGWRLAVADPAAGLAVLRRASRAGAGGVRLASAPKRPDLWGNPPGTTVAQALADPGFTADNTYAATRIEADIRLLKREVGLTDAEVVRVPALFHEACDDCDDGATEATEAGGARDLVLRPRAAATQRRLVAMLPSALNGVLLAPDRYLAPSQFGPVVGGRDVLAAAVTTAYRSAGITVAYTDDWYAYHAGKGDIHCGTNVLRAYTTPWWRA